MAHAHELLVYSLDAESHPLSAQLLSLTSANPVLVRDTPVMQAVTLPFTLQLWRLMRSVYFLPRDPMSASRVSTLKRKDLLGLVSQIKIALHFRGALTQAPQCIQKVNRVCTGI